MGSPYLRGGVPRTVLALVGLVGERAAPLLDAVVAFGFETVHGLLVALAHCSSGRYL